MAKAPPETVSRSALTVAALCCSVLELWSGRQLTGRLLQAMHVYTCRKVGGCGEGIGWALMKAGAEAFNRFCSLCCYYVFSLSTDTKMIVTANPLLRIYHVLHFMYILLAVL